jgi:membrane dipeptidase
MRYIDRRTLILAAAAGAASMVAGSGRTQGAQVDPAIGFAPDNNFLAQANRLLARVPAIDIHAHPGRTFGQGAVGLSPPVAAMVAGGSFEARAMEDMRAGGLAGGSFSAVADVQLLDARGTALVATRPFGPGEAQASYERQIANLKTNIAANGGDTVLVPSDFTRLKRQGKVAAMLTVEGGDFLVGDVSRVKVAFNDGVRSITLVHYRPNELGDIQTAPAVAGNLTGFGREVVAEMGRLGMIIDVAHATEAVVAGILATTDRPVMCSHTHVLGHGVENARFISEGLARDIADHGGVVGAWPAGIGANTLNDFVDRIFQLSEVVGPKHVSLGTDMDANYRPIMTSYRQLPLVVSELLRRGYGVDDTTAFLGGNFLRVFKTVWAKREDAPLISWPDLWPG